MEQNEPNWGPGAIGRRSFLAAAAGGPLAVGATPRRPNILFLIADDLTFRGVGGLGNDEVRTPAIDGMIERGCTFTQCFHQGSWSAAVCVPSRTMLNSGLTSFHARDRIEQAPLWGETFRNAGYDTRLVGKWHLSDETLKRSFRKTGPVSPGMFESGPEAYNRPSAGNSWTPWDTGRKGQWLHSSQWGRRGKDEIRHSAELWADAAIEQLHDLARGADPFLLYVGFNSPHDPRQAPKEFLDRYPVDRVRIPSNYLPQHPFDQGDFKIRDEVLAPFPRTREAVQLHRAEYYAHISYLDSQIGRILGALEKTGRAADTHVIITSDHGLAVGEHGLMGKQNLYEHSVRVPYVIAGPGIAHGRRIDSMVYQHSTFATTCDLAGVTPPRSLEFPSAAGLLRDGSGELHDAVFCWYRQFQRSVRTREHKLIVYPHIGVTQLFDLVHDPWETKDLAGEARYAALKADLLTRLRRFQRELGDDVCQPV